MNTQLVFVLLALYLLVLCSNKTEGFWGFSVSSDTTEDSEDETDSEDEAEAEAEAPHVHTPAPHTHPAHTPVPHTHPAHTPVPHTHGHTAHAPVPHTHGHTAHAPVSHKHDYVEHTHAPTPFSIFDAKELSFIPKELRDLVTDHQIEGLIGEKLELIFQGLQNICSIETDNRQLVNGCNWAAEIKKHILQNIACLQHIITQLEDDDIKRGFVILKHLIPLGGDIDALSEEHQTTVAELEQKYIKVFHASRMKGTERNIECMEALEETAKMLMKMM